MGSVRKWTAAFLAVCVLVTSVGMDVWAQYITDESFVMKQESKAVGEEQTEARDNEEAQIRDEEEAKAGNNRAAKEADNKEVTGLLNFAMVEIGRASCRERVSS